MSTGLTTTKQTSVSTSTTTSPSAIVTTKTTTTVTTSQYDNGVIDISIIPYIPNRQVSFIARGLRPNRRVWFNFDGQDVTDYIIKSDYLRMQDNTNVLHISTVGFSANADIVTAGAGSDNIAPVLAYGRYFDTGNANTTLQDTGDSRDRKRKFHLYNGAQINGRFLPGQTLTLHSSGNTGTIEYYETRGGGNLASWFSSNTANTVQLPIRSVAMANNFWGTDGSNTITFVPGKKLAHPPLTANIVGFNNVTRTLTLSSAQGTLANLVSASISDPVSIFTPAGDISFSIGQTFYTDDEGQISGIFNIPAGMFRTGERIFRIIDDPSNDTSSATTYADYKFDATGIQETKDSIVMQSTSVSSVQSITPVVTPTPTPSTPPATSSSSGKGGGSFGVGQSDPGWDPIAQQFYVTSAMFLTSLDIFFRSKDNILPVTVDIRPMVNGYPSSISVVPLSVSVKLSENVNISDDASIPTNFKFATPVYLPPGDY